MQGLSAAGLGLLVGYAAAALLIPLVEVLAGGGAASIFRCRHCGGRLGALVQLPLVRHGPRGRCRRCDASPRRSELWFELGALCGSGLLFGLRFGLALPLDLLVLWLGLAVAAVDMRRRIIPNRLLLAAAALGLLALLPLGGAAYLAGALGALLLLTIGLLIAWIGRGGFGLGDVKYLGVVGLMLGWQRGLATLFLAVLVGGLYAAGLLLTRRATGRDAFAFGPFIALASVAVVLLGATAAR